MAYDFASDNWTAITPTDEAPSPLPDHPYTMLMVEADGNIILWNRKGVEQPQMVVKAGVQYMLTFSGVKTGVSSAATGIIGGKKTDHI